MKYLLLITFITLSISNTSFAQGGDMTQAKKNAFVAAKVMNDALVTKDWYTYVETNHPKVIEQIEGGVPGLVKQTKEQVAQLEAAGNTIIAAWPGQPSDIIDTAGEYQLTIPQYMEIRLPTGKLKTETTLIGISQNKGKKWYFIDLEASGNDVNKLREMFPTISSKIKANTPKQPVFTPDK